MEDNPAHIGVKTVDQATSPQAHLIVAQHLNSFHLKIVETAVTKTETSSSGRVHLPKFVSTSSLPTNRSKERWRTSLSMLLGRRHGLICSIGLGEIGRRVASGVAEDELQIFTITFSIAACQDAYGQLE